ncbi:MAG: type II secretion system F family protein [Haloferacaceae archaeon]
MLWTLPLLLAIVLLLPVVLSPFSRRANLLLSRLALPTFGFYVANRSSRRTREEELLRAAYVGQTHRVYAARTLAMATLAGLSGSILGVYLAAGVMTLLAVQREAIVSLTPDPLNFLAGLTNLQGLAAEQLFLLLLCSSATVGTALAIGTYWLRWRYLAQKATARAREINATLPRTVAFIFALSRSGMPFPAVLDTLTRNQRVYGEAAREIGIAVREMNAFGTDVLTSLQRMAARTPSGNLEEFGENLASVLGSGRSLSEFLQEQYDQYQKAAEAQQEQYLNLLSTFAEVYVTVFVAGPLFFITVLVIVGLVIQSTITLTRIIGYVAIPLASLAFAVYINSMTGSLESPADDHTGDVDVTVPTVDAATDPQRTVAGHSRTDGGVPASGHRANLERLAAYDRFRPIRSWIDHPLESITEYPLATFAVTVPLGLVWIATRVGSLPASPMDLARVADEPLIEAAIFALGTFSVVHEYRKRRTEALETSIPDLLDRMASVNEAGMTIVESIHRMTQSDLGALTPEIERTWQDIRWGADAKTALRRLDRRTDSIAITRAVTLITNAMRASGNIAPVLRIAADEAYEIRRLRRERRQEMFTYQMVIYIAFFVFLGIVVALTVSFIPAVEQAAGAGGASGGFDSNLSSGLFTSIGDVNTAAYQLVFYHIAVIQAVCSGLIAGQLGEGGLYDGAKHATVMLALAYVTFLFI